MDADVEEQRNLVDEAEEQLYLAALELEKAVELLNGYPNAEIVDSLVWDVRKAQRDLCKMIGKEFR
jgi:hypothetical protein